MKKFPIILTAIVLVFAAALIVVVLTSLRLRTEIAEEEPHLQGKYKNRVDAKFVGSQACKKCHERRYLEWRTSLHSRMMRDVKESPDANIGDFDSPSEVRTFKKVDVDFTLGSQWKQQYLIKEGNDIFVLPAQYNVPTGEWKAYFPDEPTKRNWFNECAGCHATGVDPEKKTYVEMGIACEACHGPGGNHVEAVPGYEISTIMQAGRMTPAQAAQICGSCHTRGRDKKNAKYAYSVDYQFNKGIANIRLYFDEATPELYPEYFWPSGESKYSNQQYLDWKLSEHAKVGVVCNTCHNVHKAKTTLVSSGMAGTSLLDSIMSKTRLFEDRLCKSCHTTNQYRYAHRIHTFGSCVRCHMPRVARIGEAGDAHSHTFRCMYPQARI